MAHAHATPGIDPRKIITPESFSVAPHLLGLPLASPTRRLVAILLDLLLVSIVANLGGKVLFALLCAVAFFWFAGRRLGKGGNFFSKTAKLGLRGVGTLFLFISALALWSKVSGKVSEELDDDGDAARPAAVQAGVAGGAPRKNPSLGAVIRSTAEIAAVASARDSATAWRAATHVVPALRRLGMADADIRKTMEETASANEDGKPWVAAALRAHLPAAPSDSAATDTARADSAAGETAVPADPDSLAAAYVAAVRAGDGDRADALRPKLATVLAKDSLGALREEVGELQRNLDNVQRERDEARQSADKAENRGLLATLLGLLDDLGIGFGWTALYFTFFTAMMKGQTPAKKLLGIRVLRLDGEPMTLWASFERYGGYAAGLFTGLTGYMQVYWDRNRQAVQDKISETVVIRHLPGLVLPEAPKRGAPAMAGARGPIPAAPYSPPFPRPGSAPPYSPPGGMPPGPGGPGAPRP